MNTSENKKYFPSSPSEDTEMGNGKRVEMGKVPGEQNRHSQLVLPSLKSPRGLWAALKRSSPLQNLGLQGALILTEETVMELNSQNQLHP